MKAFSVSFTNAPTGPGRHGKSTYKTACVIAKTVSDAVAKAEQYCQYHFPKLHVEEVPLEDDLVIE